jgi:GT2 family glycosyltransferase
MLQSVRSLFPEPVRRLLRATRARVLSLGLPRDAEFPQPKSEIEASGDMSVIIPVCNETDVLTRCLRSLEKYAPRAEVIIVDDASTAPDTPDILEEFTHRNGYNLIRQPASTGHSRACESGARLATRKYLCLLNADTIVTPWSWQAAKEAFELDPKIGITGPSTSQMATAQAIRRAELCRFYWTDRQVHAFAKQYVSKRPVRSWIDLPEVGGFAFFIRRNLWEEFGGFDPNLPDYGNEFELCRRAAKEGWRVVWTTNSYIHHLGHQSYSQKFGMVAVKERGRRAQEYINAKYR